MITYFRNNQAVAWLGIEPVTASHKSNVPLHYRATSLPLSVAGAPVCSVNAVRDLGVFIDYELGPATNCYTI